MTRDAKFLEEVTGKDIGSSQVLNRLPVIQKSRLRRMKLRLSEINIEKVLFDVRCRGAQSEPCLHLASPSRWPSLTIPQAGPVQNETLGILSRQIPERLPTDRLYRA